MARAKKISRALRTLQSTFWRTWRNPRALGKEPGLGPGVGSPSRRIGSGVGDGDGIGLRQVETYHPSGTNIGDLVLAAVMASVTVLEPEGAAGAGAGPRERGSGSRSGRSWSGGSPVGLLQWWGIRRAPERAQSGCPGGAPGGGTVGGSGRLAGGRNGRCPRSGHFLRCPRSGHCVVRPSTGATSGLRHVVRPSTTAP